jgi:phosphatidylglycerol lysyltransferase
MLLTAILLFMLSGALERGKRVAWLATIAALVFAPLIHLGYAVIWPQVLLNLPLILLLVANRRYFVARTDRRALRSALIICPILLAALLIYGTIRLHDLRFETSGPDSWLGCFQAACELEFVQNAKTQQAQTHQALILFSELRIGGTLVMLLALYLTMGPVLPRRKADAEQRARARRLIDEFGGDPLNSYALMADKNFFFTAARDAGISYVVSGRFAVTLADPVGPRHAQARAVAEFTEFCRHQDWVPLFYEVGENLLEIYETAGFAALKIGEDARLEAQSFELKGRAFQNLRTLANKARRAGLHFRWYEAALGLDLTLEAQLAEISKRWLEGKKRTEMSFDMGSFSSDELRHGVGVAMDADGKPHAFVTWRSFNQNRGRVLDLMRSRPEAHNVLDFALLESIAHFRRQGISDISLGNAPLADAQGHSPTSMEGRVIRFIYEHLNLIYAYKPLFEFKRKYRPQWRARHLAYPVGESLPMIGLALVRVHLHKKTWRFLTG